MKIIRNQTPMIMLIMMTFAALSSFPSISYAEDGQSRWLVKTAFVLVDANEPFAVDTPAGGRIQAGGNAELGAMMALEYRWSKLLGLEFGVAYARSPDVDGNVNGNSESIGEGPAFLPVFGGLNFYLVNTSNLDLYVGPRIAFVNFGDFDLDVDSQQVEYNAGDEFAWGASAGVSYRFDQSHWSLIAEASYIDVDMTISETDGSNNSVVGFDPLMVNIGASYRF